MSRPVYWPSDGAYVLDFEGHPHAGAPVRIWSAQSGGVQVTDLQRVDASGAPTGAVPGGILISDANGLIPAFAGPDGGPTTLWGDHGYAGARLALSADPVTSSGGGAQFTSVLGKASGTVAGSDVLADAAVSAALAGKLPTTGTAADSVKVGGIAITGTPTAGQVPTATSGSAASWSTPASGAGDATTSAKGVVQLAGDLAGTAAAPTVPALTSKAPLASPDLTGTPTAPTASALTNTTQVATTAYADSATGVERTRALAAEVLLAPLASPALTGTPTAPTASGGTNTTQVATTAFVEGEVASKAPLASPALTGVPTVPTAAVDTSTTQAASTAFVVAQAASATPLIDGTAAVGTSTRFARGDHKHPTDTTRAAAATTITAGTGLTGGGDLTTDRTLTVAYGTTSGTAAQGNDSRITGAAAAATTITAGTGLTGGGSLAANRTLAVSYGTTSGTAAQGDDTRITGAAQRTGGNTFTGTQDFTGATVTGISGSVSDATTSTKGIVQLAGDLAGTAAAPTVPGLAAKATPADITAALNSAIGLNLMLGA